MEHWFWFCACWGIGYLVTLLFLTEADLIDSWKDVLLCLVVWPILAWAILVQLVKRFMGF